MKHVNFHRFNDPLVPCSASRCPWISTKPLDVLMPNYHHPFNQNGGEQVFSIILDVSDVHAYIYDHIWYMYIDIDLDMNTKYVSMYTHHLYINIFVLQTQLHPKQICIFYSYTWSMGQHTKKNINTHNMLHTGRSMCFRNKKFLEVKKNTLDKITS